MRKREKAMMLGLGFDCKDGHERITKGDNFYLAGGSEETHECMAETAIKINETLKKRGKTLESLEYNEFRDIVEKCSGK